MIEYCEWCGKFTKLEEIKNYNDDKIYLCPECFEQAERKADYEQHRYKEEGGK